MYGKQQNIVTQPHPNPPSAPTHSSVPIDQYLIKSVWWGQLNITTHPLPLHECSNSTIILQSMCGEEQNIMTQPPNPPSVSTHPPFLLTITFKKCVVGEKHYKSPPPRFVLRMCGKEQNIMTQFPQPLPLLNQFCLDCPLTSTLWRMCGGERHMTQSHFCSDPTISLLHYRECMAGGQNIMTIHRMYGRGQNILTHLWPTLPPSPPVLIDRYLTKTV